MVTKSGWYKGGTCSAGDPEESGSSNESPQRGATGNRHRKRKMQPNFSLCCFSLLFIHFIGAKPISDMQSLQQLLEDEISSFPLSSEEAQAEESDFGSVRSEPGAAGRREPWSAADRRRSAPPARDNALARFLKDIMTSSKRSWSRYKKGGLRSCFGVRLERIGSFSGLGCHFGQRSVPEGAGAP